MVAPAIVAAGIGAAGSLLGGIFGSDSADDAAQTQIAANREMIDWYRERYAQDMEMFDRLYGDQQGKEAELERYSRPATVAGRNAQNVLAYELGLTPNAPTLIDNQARETRRNILEGDRNFNRLSGADVYRGDDGQFYYGRDPRARLDITERTIPGGTREVTSVAGAGSRGEDGRLLGPDEFGTQITRTVSDPDRTLFNVGGRTFDSRREARDFIRSKDRKAFSDGFETRADARNALQQETRRTKRNLLAGTDKVRSEYQGYEMTPGARYAMDEAIKATETSAAAAGNLLSGNTLEAIEGQAQGIVAQDYGNYLNRLAGTASQGLNAKAGAQGMNPMSMFPSLAGISQNYGANVGNALGGIGAANANASINKGNIWSGTMGDIAGLAGWGYQQWGRSQPYGTNSLGGLY